MNQKWTEFDKKWLFDQKWTDMDLNHTMKPKWMQYEGKFFFVVLVESKWQSCLLAYY